MSIYLIYEEVSTVYHTHVSDVIKCIGAYSDVEQANHARDVSLSEGGRAVVVAVPLNDRFELAIKVRKEGDDKVESKSICNPGGNVIIKSDEDFDYF